MNSEHRFIRRLALLMLAAILLFGFAGCKKQEEEKPKIGYADGVTVVDDPDALQKAVDEMYEKVADGNIALEYRGEATSEDGENFSCYIANSLNNSYDMYLQIFADEALTDQLLLTGLIRPGSAFDNLTLEHPLESGNHTVYVAFTQVEEDLETIHAQVIVTMEFQVS